MVIVRIGADHSYFCKSHVTLSVAVLPRGRFQTSILALHCHTFHGPLVQRLVQSHEDLLHTHLTAAVLAGSRQPAAGIGPCTWSWTRSHNALCNTPRHTLQSPLRCTRLCSSRMHDILLTQNRDVALAHICFPKADDITNHIVLTFLIRYRTVTKAHNHLLSKLGVTAHG